jgi:UPF0755 protein
MKLARIFGLLFLFSFGFTIFVTQLSLPGSRGEHVRINVASGESIQNISETLKEHGLITSASAFRLYLKSREIDTSIKTGTFVIERGMSFEEIADILVSGEGSETSVTIPEGFTIAQIDDLLAEMGLIETGEAVDCAKTCDFSSFEFLSGKSPEGYIFPDTYFVNALDFSPKNFLERLIGTFKNKVIDGLAEDLDSSKRSLKEVVIMASLIERETSTNEERPVVSGILWKRYDAGRGLDVDATVRYALNKPTGPLTKADLESTSPYNTRKFAGLPPGPIANPGLASIRAALNPEDSSYWYYLHGSDGQIYYAETNDEHNVNKAKYL